MEYKCKNCGCDEFITQPNKYDIYRIIDNEPVFQRKELISEKEELLCRNCFTKYTSYKPNR
jgi:hypothetical protein